MIRTFVAIDLRDNQLKYYVNKIQDLIRSFKLRATYPDPNQIHITLKFIGEVDESLIPKIIESLSKIRHDPFPINISGIDGFPSLNRPRVIFIDVKNSREIDSLYQKIENSLKFLGRYDNHPFHPHITVARIKTPYKWSPDLTTALKKLSFSIELFIDYFTLKRSVLTPQGPEYSDLHVFRLWRQR